MDSHTGQIHNFANEEELKKAKESLGDALVEIDEKDMTKKQKKEMKVSKYDTKSTLGKIRQTTIKKIGRNTSCPCGSGKKYKKCCLK
ncbi:hypothetical protein LCGC14_1527220 [marine sediment metagenome]|uniref:Uncharacterized protein n=1 Tax=marine sediment metagenome TaxID=412755 RepID=A0A0F9JHS8_9ZZZZ